MVPTSKFHLPGNVGLTMSDSTILIVEDERIVAKDLELRLKTLGYVIVGSVASGEEAVQLTAQLLPDLVIMDIRLNGELDGIEAADRIRKKHFIPVIYLTAHSDEETLQRTVDRTVWLLAETVSRT